MSKKNNTVQEFEQYAENKLKDHISELNTRYENEKPGKQELQQAYQAHHEIFNKELDEKMQSLLSSESDSRMKEDMENIKETWLNELHLKDQ